MKLVDALSLQQKLYMLLALILSGMIITAALGYFNMQKMKQNLDSLYFGSLIPVTELTNIQNTYNKKVTTAFYQLKDQYIAPANAAATINSAREEVLKNWASYKSHFKRDYETAYIDYATSEIEKSAHYLKRLNSAILRLDKEHLGKLSSSSLLGHIHHINQIIENILTYEKQVAQFERRNLIETYDETNYKLLAILVFIIAAAVITIVPIFKSIQNNEASLIQASKKLQVANKRLETASITDALTDLYNRRYFNLVYNRELTRSIREGKSIAFMMLDVDFFKGYNDSYGHLQGDKALKQVATVMKETLMRPGDYLFRLGGEEFGILIADIEHIKAHKMAEKLRKRVQSLGIEHKESEVDSSVTVSIGLVTLFADQNTKADYILHKADENLYEAKAKGRNRVISSELTEDRFMQTA